MGVSAMRLEGVVTRLDLRFILISIMDMHFFQT